MNKRLFLAFAMLLTFCSYANAGADVCDFSKDGIFYKIQSDGSVFVWYEDGSSWDPCYTLGCYVIPETVTYEGTTYTVTGIGHTAFYGCTNVNYVSLPKTIKNIEYRAFVGCTSLENIICYATDPPTLSSEAFTGLFDKVTFWVPSSAVDTYKARTGWKNFSNIDSIENLDAYAVYDSDSQTLTFYYDDQKEMYGDNAYYMNEGNATPDWIDYSNPGTIQKVVFTISFQNARPTSTYDWFYNQPSLTEIVGIEYLNTSEVENMDEMFFLCSGLETIALNKFDTGKVKTMWLMFGGCTSLTTLDLSSFNTTNVTDMSNMFEGSSSLTTLDLRNFDTSIVTKMQNMFCGCTNLKTIIVGEKWNTQNVTESSDMFTRCKNIKGGAGTTYNISYIDKTYARIDGGETAPGYLSSVVQANSEAYAVYDSDSQTLTFYYDDQKETYGDNAYYMNEKNACPGWIDYDNPKEIKKVKFHSTFQNARPTSTYDWFYCQSSLTEIDGIENLNTSEVENMDEMFFMCSGLGTIALNNFDTGNVKTMNLMFDGCSGLTSLDVSKFNTAKVTSMSCLFSGCSDLTTLDLRNFDTSNVTNMQMMFYGCTKLKTIIVGEKWNTQNVTESSDMFSGCTSIKGGAGTLYDSNKTDKEYAHADGLGGAGYLTAVSYGITVSGKAVTFANKSDVLGNETVYYDDDLNTLSLNNANVSSISIASSAPKNLRILVFGDCKVAHTATKGDAFTTSIASTTIEGQGEAKLTISSKNGVGINIKRSSSAGLLVKDIDLVVKGNTAGIIGTANATQTRFYSSLAFENTNCNISRVGGEQGSVGIINKMVLEKCHWTTGEFDKTNHYVLANPMVIERDVIGITTGVENGQRNSVKGQRDEWYTIDGQKLSGKPAKKGIYLHNGKKIVKQ